MQAVHPVGYASFARAELVHRVPGTSPDELLAVAVDAAAAADLAIVVVGTNEEIESEGYDRTSLALPGTQDQLVKAALAANPRTIVVVNAGAPVLLPWLDEVPCVLWAWLGGQEWPDALADVLTGITEPTGRLPWTLPAHESDVPVPDAVPVDGVIEYHEGVHVGYRSWLRLDRTPAAPFGHGLGWTTWEYESVSHAVEADGSVVLDVRVRNTGARDGREVVQVYVEPPEHRTSRVRSAGSAGSAVVHAAAGRARRCPGPGGRRCVPDLGQRTARLGHPGRYLPDPRRPLVERPAPQRRRGRAQSLVGIGTAPASPGPARSAVPSDRHDQQFPHQCKEALVRIRKLSTVVATAATLALLATACSGGGGSSDDSTGGADGVSDKILTIGMPNGPQQPNQNPLATGSASLSLGYAFAVYESLMQVNELKPTDPPTPWLAESRRVERRLDAGRHHRP